MAVGTLPLAAALTALSAPVMSVLAFGQAAEGDGPQLLGAALLGPGRRHPRVRRLPPDDAGRLRPRRQPHAGAGVAGLGRRSAPPGMVVAGQVADGSTRLALVGGAHTLAYAAGRALAGRRACARGWARCSGCALAAPARPGRRRSGGLAWAVMEAWSPEGRLAVLVALAVIGGGRRAPLYVAGLRALGALPGPRADRRSASGGRRVTLAAGAGRRRRARPPGSRSAPRPRRRGPPRRAGAGALAARARRGTSCTRATRRPSTRSSTSRPWRPCRCATCCR